MTQARDAYLRERLHDLEDLADRLLRILAGETPGSRVLPEDAVLIARNLGPADLLEYDRTKLRGLLLEEGSPAPATPPSSPARSASPASAGCRTCATG